jgi:hypothetical protein
MKPQQDPRLLVTDVPSVGQLTPLSDVWLLADTEGFTARRSRNLI